MAGEAVPGVRLMTQDEIIEEVRAIREAYGARFEFDVRALYTEAKRSERPHPASPLMELVPAAQPVADPGRRLIEQPPDPIQSCQAWSEVAGVSGADLSGPDLGFRVPGDEPVRGRVTAHLIVPGLNVDEGKHPFV